MTLAEIKNFIKENFNKKPNYFVVQYTTLPTYDVEYDFCKHWFDKSFNTLKEAKEFYDKTVEKCYNVNLITYNGNSLVILDSIGQ